MCDSSWIKSQFYVMITFKCDVYLVILDFRFSFVITYLSIKYKTKNRIHTSNTCVTYVYYWYFTPLLQVYELHV